MFSIHPQLLADCHVLGQHQNIHYLLHKNAALHWFILVPETTETVLLNLPTSQLNTCMSEAQKVSDYLLSTLSYPHSNVASIGNVVSQLHLHVVGRHPNDVCWPQPVWGNLQSDKRYSDQDLQQITSDLQL